MKTHGGLQDFLERRAEGPVFAVVAICMIARAAQFYSGGALLLSHVLGAVGMGIFNGLTGAGLAVACELLMSIAGRAWRAEMREANEVRGRRGISKQERAALLRHFEGNARLHKSFMLLGLGASCTAAFFFFWTATSVHTLAGVIGDAVVTLLLVAAAFYLGVIKEARGESPEDVAQADSYQIRRDVAAAAGERIRANAYTAQDVRVVARALPRAERERFESAMIAPNADDPYWTAREIADWLGMGDDSGRRQVGRKLSRAMDKGLGIIRDETQRNAYQVPRSVVLQLFADEFIRRNTTGATSGQARGVAPLAASGIADTDTTGAPAGQLRKPSSGGLAVLADIERARATATAEH